MTVQHEIKSQLAKLLATEDLIVEHKKVETAFFNVSSRVLTLPLWDKASNIVYDMLVGHEVGHALYTPDEEWWKRYKVPPSFVNIIEDVRIEKLMKRRYAGLSKSFYYGYQELNDDNFFSIDPDNLEEMGFADRINLHFKIGNFVDVPFLNDREREIVSMINATESFDDVLEAAHVLYEYCQELQDAKEKEELELKINANDLGFDGESSGGSSPSDDELPDFPEGEDLSEGKGGSGEGDKENKEVDADPDQHIIDPNQPWDQGEMDEAWAGMEGGNSELELDTVKAFEEAMKKLSNMASGQESVYVEMPKVDDEKLVVSNEYIHNLIDADWIRQEAEHQERSYKNEINGLRPSKPLFEKVDADFVQFKRNAAKEVSYLVKEFECKKSASAYARATVSRTGVLDCTKLHTYKYSEDLFKKITTLPEGKNHGLIFLLDWSGSMSHVMMDTVKQLLNLIWFCKKVNIPFQVYAFTNSFPIHQYREEVFGQEICGEYATRRPDPKVYEKKEGVFQIDDGFCLMNLLSSKVKTKELDKQIKSLFRIAYTFAYRSFDYNYPVRTPYAMGLSGTPLNESLIAFNSIIPKFQKENGVEKVQCVILTDGEAHPLSYHREVQRDWEENPYLGTRHVHDNCYVRDRKTGHTYPVDSDYKSFTEVILRHLRNRFPDTNFIGIRILDSREHGYFIRRYVGAFGTAFDKAMKDWKKTKSCTISDAGYNKYFALSSSALSNDAEFEVKEDATKAQIKSAFTKSLKGKKMNKKVLGEFIELIA